MKNMNRIELQDMNIKYDMIAKEINLARVYNTMSTDEAKRYNALADGYNNLSDDDMTGRRGVIRLETAYRQIMADHYAAESRYHDAYAKTIMSLSDEDWAKVETELDAENEHTATGEPDLITVRLCGSSEFLEALKGREETRKAIQKYKMTYGQETAAKFDEVTQPGSANEYTVK